MATAAETVLMIVLFLDSCKPSPGLSDVAIHPWVELVVQTGFPIDLFSPTAVTNPVSVFGMINKQAMFHQQVVFFFV